MWQGLLVALAVLGLLGLKSNNPAPSSDDGGLGDVAAAVDVTGAVGGAPAAASKSTLPNDEMTALDGEHTTSGKKPFDAVAAAAAAAQKRRRERPSRRRFYDDDADDDDDDAAGRWRRKVDGGALPSDDVPKWIPTDWAKQLFSSAVSGAKKKTNEEVSAAAAAAEKAGSPAELESDDAIAQREAREYERAVRQEWLFARAVGAAQDAWKRLAPKVENPESVLLAVHDECTTRAFMRGTTNWTCIRVDAEASFAPKEVATLPAPGMKTTNTAAICLVGQVHSLMTTSHLIRERIADAFPNYELFVFAHPSSTRPDGQVENWDILSDARGRGARFQTADEQARTMAAELARPNVAAALDALEPTAVRFFNATQYEAEMGSQEQGPCFERVTPKGALNKGDMPCCHFSHRGPALWGVSQCLAMVQEREAAKKKIFRWVVRARPDYIPQEELGHVIRSEIVGGGSPDNPGEQGRVPRVWMRHGPFADSFQVATRAAMDALGSAYTELKDNSCLALPQEEGKRRTLCRQLMGSSAVAWTNECLIAMHVRRLGVQLNIGDAFGAGRFIRPPVSNGS